MRPLISVAIDGKPERLIVDTGAFWSMLPDATARRLGLKLRPAPGELTVSGIGGGASVDVASVTLTMAGQPIPKVDFLVGGSDMGGEAGGLLGQNMLGRAAIEYDLANGVMRMFRITGCGGRNLAYWANDLPVSVVSTTPTTALEPHHLVPITVNGIRMRAMLDTGAPISALSRRAAALAGVRPGDANVTASEDTGGIGRRAVRSWVGRFDSFSVGGVKVNRPKLQFIEGGIMDGIDMLLGLDFFLSNRVLIVPEKNLIYFTYNGGRMFNLSVRPVATVANATAGVPTPADRKATESLDADGYARRGAALASRGDVSGALGDLDRAIDLDPRNAEYHLRRASARLRLEDEKGALQDLDAGIAIDPENAHLRLLRAQTRLAKDDAAGARTDADAVRDLIAVQSDLRKDVGSIYSALRAYPDAVAQYRIWIAHHANDGKLADTLNGVCWASALGSFDLDQSLAACNKSVSLRRRPPVLDSRGLLQLRRKAYAAAIADYDAALAARPDLASSLYGRGIARLRLGREEAGRADIAAAKKADADVVKHLQEAGVEP